jgi:hypothetical protein
LTQRIEDVGAADVAGMDDESRSLQRCDRLRAQQAMGIGDDADISHWFPAGGRET